MSPWVILILVLAAEPTPAWPGFLGVNASPVNAEAVPSTWSPTEHVAWKVNVPGKGQSSPVIWGERVFVTSISGKMKEKCHVSALSLNDGRQLWDHSQESSQQVEANYFQSQAAPTPVVDEKGIFAFFETGDVVALSHQGKVLWQRSLTKDFGDFITTSGLAASPVIAGGSVILQIDHEGPSYLIALDKDTGATRWKTERKSAKNFSSPMLIPIGDENHLVCSGDGAVDGYDPPSGRLLWSFTEVGGNTATSPLPFGQGRFLIGASAGRQGERESEAKQSNLAMEVAFKDGAWQPRVLWRNEKTTPTFASPMVYRGHAYWINRVGVIHCFDAETGELRFAQRTKQMCWATPVGVGDRVYFFGKDGVTSVIATGPEFKVLAENSLWDESAGVDPLNARRSQADRSKESAPSAESKDRPASGEGRRPASNPGEDAELRKQMAGKFPDPVQYGVAIVNGSLVIRTGDTVYCIRSLPVNSAGGSDASRNE